ncbi:MAG: efflux RND transporter periplasmic adaptor subunit [Aquificaceae bacterium]
MRKYAKYLGFIFIISLVVMWLAGVFERRERAEEIRPEAKKISGFKFATVERVDEVDVYYTGNVVADKVADISTRLMGVVKNVKVKEGDRVRSGQPLINIDGKDVEAQIKASNEQIRQAEEAYRAALAQHEATKKTYERYLSLLKEQAITQQEFDQIKAKYEASQAAIEQAKAAIRASQFQRQAIASNLSYTTLVAPFDGYVVAKNVDIGDMAAPGTSLLIIEKLPYKFEVNLPEVYVNRIKLGDSYEIYVDRLNREIKGTVVEVSPSLDPSTRTFKIKLLLEKADGLKSGMYARLLLPEKRKALLVPEGSIVRKFDFTGVWVVKQDNTLELRLIKLGEKRGDKWEVLSGLKEGEKIVVEGVEKACDGCRIGG